MRATPITLSGYALLMLLPLLPMAHATAEALPDGPHVQVQGQGEVEAMPDTVIISLDVTRTAPETGEARRQVDRIAADIQAVAERFDVRGDDYRASRIQIQPEYEWTNGKRHLLGQQVSRQFELTLRDIERYGELIQGLAETEISALRNIRFDFSNRTELYRQAERLAAAAARDQAANLAAAMDARLGRIYSVSASGAAPAPMPRAEMMMMSKAADSAPVQAGLETIEARVSAVFTIKPN